jgi:hypothetical protein
MDAVWAAWASGDGLRAWFASHAENDMRLGGLMRTNCNPQGVLGALKHTCSLTPTENTAWGRKMAASRYTP